MRSLVLIVVLGLLPLSAPVAAQTASNTVAAEIKVHDVHLRGTFVPVRAPAADARPASGDARALIQPDGNVRIDLVVSGLVERPTGAALHTGKAGENGEQVGRMDLAVDGGDARVIGATLKLTPAIADQVRSGAAYLLIQSSEHPDGVLRAQLTVQPRTLDPALPGK